MKTPDGRHIASLKGNARCSPNWTLIEIFLSCSTPHSLPRC